MRTTIITLSSGLLLLTQASYAQTCEDLINLSFSTNSGDVANHANISNISAWTNGSETTPDPFNSGIYYMPDDDFGNGYAGLTVPSPRFGWKWGFEGSFDVTGSEVWDVCEISFDYDVLGHNGEALLDLAFAGWTGSAPLPSTGVDGSGPIFTPVSVGEQATGSVTFDFTTNTLTVTRNGYGDYTTAFSGSASLGAGSHAIDILTSNTKPSSGGAFDANADSVGSATEGFYRIDNFKVIGQQVPEPSSALLGAVAGGLFLLRRRR